MQTQTKPRYHDKTTKQVRNAVSNIFFGSIILAGIVLSFISYFAYANNDVGSNSSSIAVDENLTNKKPIEWRRLNSNGYSQKYVSLTWFGRDERAIQLLQAYGFKWQEERSTIKTISRIHRIYPETILCIIYADSSIGRFLKTEHNYGNVWNTDSGKTQAYTNMEQWLNAVGRVLNNKYLWQYTLIGQLSPYWEMNGSHFYATSKENWGINVLNCLWMIHNKQINNDFNFRW